jgi:hypothetical protein
MFCSIEKISVSEWFFFALVTLGILTRVDICVMLPKVSKTTVNCPGVYEEKKLCLFCLCGLLWILFCFIWAK